MDKLCQELNELKKHSYYEFINTFWKVIRIFDPTFSTHPLKDLIQQEKDIESKKEQYKTLLIFLINDSQTQEAKSHYQKLKLLYREQNIKLEPFSKFKLRVEKTPKFKPRKIKLNFLNQLKNLYRVEIKDTNFY